MVYTVTDMDMGSVSHLRITSSTQCQYQVQLRLRNQYTGNAVHRNIKNKRHDTSKQSAFCTRYPELPELNAACFCRMLARVIPSSICHQSKTTSETKKKTLRCIIKRRQQVGRRRRSKRHISIFWFFRGKKRKKLVWIVSYHCLLQPPILFLVKGVFYP